MQTVLVKQIRPPSPCAVGNRIEVTHYKEIVDREAEERDSTSTIKQNGKASGGHNICGKQ